MSELLTRIYSSGSQLPEGLSRADFFHSQRLFELCAHTPRIRPYMVTVETSQGHVCAQMLALVRYRTVWLPPWLLRHCRVLGEGVYTSDTDHAELMGLMLEALTRKLGRWMLYMEVSHLSQKMTGYRQLRESGFFPVRWMSIQNALADLQPEETVTPKMLRRIRSATERGVRSVEVTDEAGLSDFLRLLRHHNWLKPKRYIPADEFFKGLLNSGDSRLALTLYRDHVIGCSAVVFSGTEAYLWYAAYRRKSFAWLHPDVLTVWHAIKNAHSRGCGHILFMDVGLPFRKNALRDFILRFGGQPTSTYRWFRISIGWVNRLLSWFYRD